MRGTPASGEEVSSAPIEPLNKYIWTSELPEYALRRSELSCPQWSAQTHYLLGIHAGVFPMTEPSLSATTFTLPTSSPP